MQNPFRIFLALTFLINICAVAQTLTPKYSNEFLAIGVGARGMGMSRSVITSVDDATAGYWNPAGLTGLKSKLQVNLMHSEYFAGMAKYDFGSVARPIDSTSAISLSIIRFGIDGIPNTTDFLDVNGVPHYDRITSFSAADYCYLLTYAKKLKIPGLSVGANAKVVHRKIGDFGKSWGFGIDAGAIYQKSNWRFAAMARDVTTTYNAWSYDLPEQMINTFVLTGNEIPTNSVEITLPLLSVGASRIFHYKKFTALAEVDAAMTFDKKRNVLVRSDIVSADPHAGIELGYNNIIFLRGGIGNFQTVKDMKGMEITTVQPNAGVGVKFKGLSLDYALTNITESVGLLSHVFSLKLDIINTSQNRNE